jgi:hypothetical protein
MQPQAKRGQLAIDHISRLDQRFAVAGKQGEMRCTR